MNEQLDKAKQAVDAQEPRIDSWLDRLKANPHTARLVLIYCTLAVVGSFILGRCSI